MEALEIKTVFTLTLGGLTIPITETVIVSWTVMLVLIAGSLIITTRLKQIPSGPQAVLETGMEFLNSFGKTHFGNYSKILTPYMGSVFLFLLLANTIPVISPLELKIFGREFIPPFMIRPPAKDINVTAALAVLSIVIVLISGFAARGVSGWFRHLLHPLPIMLPFNIMEYATRTFSLALRLFGNILGGYVMMHMVIGLLPVVLPAIFSLYFDFFDGAIQAIIFVFLTSLYISEAIKIHGD